MSRPSPAEQNLEILVRVAQALGPLRDSLVFVGGCVTGLLVTDVRSQPIRATKDVDLIAPVATQQEYHQLEVAFRDRGFIHDTSPGAPICRWNHGEIMHEQAQSFVSSVERHDSADTVPRVDRATLNRKPFVHEPEQRWCGPHSDGSAPR